MGQEPPYPLDVKWSTLKSKAFVPLGTKSRFFGNSANSVATTAC